VLVSDFDYHLPAELIAQQPLAARDASRLLHLDRASGRYSDQSFRDFPGFLQAGDLLVFNDTRVFPARLYGRRQGARAQPVSRKNPAARDFLAGRIEVLLTRQVSAEPNDWGCLVRPGRKIGVGERLFFGEQDELQAEVLARGDFGERQIRFQSVSKKNIASESSRRPASTEKKGSPTDSQEDFFALLDRIGHVPLPPYIAREDSPNDRDRYQTVYARQHGSVAAPTAGLHFTPEVLDCIRQRDVEIAYVTLHVGLGTFQPVRTDRVEDHKLHSEAYFISDNAASVINRAIKESRRIVAVGTTTVRTLEHAFRQGAGTVPTGSGSADIFIYPGYEFKVVKAMLTNFHLPQSTPLMLVCAFAGRDNVLRAYDHAVSERYRFYSYGDCMFIE
jgi:S-adenosylmethionine:tRNA ribosyltransferase-isomerase